MKTKLLSKALLQTSIIEVHYQRPLFDSLKLVSNASDADECFRKVFNEKQISLKEFFCVMLLNRANLVIGISTISIGSISGVEVNTKEIFQLSLLTNTSSVIIAHNHPSGNLKASSSDLQITKKIKQGLDVLGVSLLDHIIITSESFLSFTQEGLL